MTPLTEGYARRHAVNFAMFLFVFDCLASISNGMIMPCMLQVIQFYGGDEWTGSMASSLYLLGGSSVYLFLGPIADSYGRRPVMLFGTLFFILVTTLILFAQSMTQFLLLRFFQGTGLSFINAVGFLALQEVFDESEAIRKSAFMTLVSLFASISGPSLGAVVMYYSYWQMVFVLTACSSLVILWGLWCYMPETLKNKSSCVNVQQLKHDYITIFSDRSFILTTLLLAILGLPCFVWIGIAPVMMRLEVNITLMLFFLWQLPILGGLIFSYFLLHKFTTFLKPNTIIWFGSIVAVLGLISIFIGCWIFGNSLIGVMPGLTLYFVGYGIAGSPLVRLILFGTTARKGVALAIFCTIIMALRALGVQMVYYHFINYRDFIYGADGVIIGVFYLILLWYVLNVLKKDPKI